MEYVLPCYATKWRLRCLDCILIEAQNDKYFIQTTGSLKVIRLDCDILGETHSGSKVQMKVEVGMYVQLAWPLYTSTNWHVAPQQPERWAREPLDTGTILWKETTHWRRFWEVARLSERADTCLMRTLNSAVLLCFNFVWVSLTLSYCQLSFRRPMKAAFCYRVHKDASFYCTSWLSGERGPLISRFGARFQFHYGTELQAEVEVTVTCARSAR